MVKISSIRPILLNADEVDQILDRERAILIRNWGRDSSHITIALASNDALHADISGYHRDLLCVQSIINYAKNIEYSRNDAFCISEQDGSNPECWVLAEKKSTFYRNLYHDFMTQFYGIGANMRLPSSIHIDHVYSRGRAKKIFHKFYGESYLRLTLAHANYNSGCGRIFEKYYNSDQELALGRFYHKNFTWPLAIKSFSCEFPRNKEYEDKIIIRCLHEMHAAGIFPSDMLHYPYAVIRSEFMKASNHTSIENNKILGVINGVKITPRNTIIEVLSLYNS